MAGAAAAPVSGEISGGRCAHLDQRRDRRSDFRRFRSRDPLRHRPLSRSRCRVIAGKRGVSGVQPAPVGDRAAAAHAGRSAPSHADPRHRRRSRPAGADLADVAESGRGQGHAGDGRADLYVRVHGVGRGDRRARGRARLQHDRGGRHRGGTAGAAVLARLPDLFAYYIVTVPGARERPKVRAFRNWLRQEADAGGGVSAGSGGDR